MTANEGLRRYLDAGIVLGQVTRARAEELVRELVDSGDLQRDQAQEWVDDLIDRSRQASEFLVAVVKHEVSTQLSNLGIDSLDEVADRVTSLIAQSAASGRKAAKAASDTLVDAREKGAARAAPRRSSSSAGAKKAGTAKAGTAPKKAAAKKSGVKKAAAKKAAATKKPVAKKAGVTAKKAGTAPKKAATKKAPSAKKSGVKRAGAAEKAATRSTPAKVAAPNQTDGPGTTP